MFKKSFNFFEQKINNYLESNKSLEENFIGLSDSKKFQELYNELLLESGHQNKDFLSLEKSIELIEKCQKENPENPSSYFSSAIFKKVQENFGPDFKLKLFSAVGDNDLNKNYYIDFFFKLYDAQNDKEIARSLIDLNNGLDEKSQKADVLITITDKEREILNSSKTGDNLSKNIFKSRIEEYEKLVVFSLEEKLLGGRALSA